MIAATRQHRDGYDAALPAAVKKMFVYTVTTIVENTKAAVQNPVWRKTPYDERKYEYLSSYATCEGLDSLDEDAALMEMRTDMKQGFLGFNEASGDSQTSENWMSQFGKSLKSLNNSNQPAPVTSEITNDPSVITAQVSACLERLKINVEESVMNDNHVIDQPEIVTTRTAASSSISPPPIPQVSEQPVWGLDGYTRFNIYTLLPSSLDDDMKQKFIEEYLLPTINNLPPLEAHNIIISFNLLLKKPLPHHSKIAFYKFKLASAPDWVTLGADYLMHAFNVLGFDYFRIHPKGHGAVCIAQEGIPAQKLITFYRGELYPAWRWSEKVRLANNAFRAPPCSHCVRVHTNPPTHHSGRGHQHSAEHGGAQTDSPRLLQHGAREAVARP